MKMKVNGSILTIEVDLSKRLRQSASGKTTLVATSAGAVKAPSNPEISIGLNVFTK